LSRYLKSETGTICKKWTDRVAIALLYPHVYGVAVSNLGYQLVYALLNQRGDIVCERFVYPDGPEPLRSLESNRPLSDFPLVMGSISFEQDYPRLAAMLAAGGIVPLATERAETVGPGAPLVVLGGVAVFMNPEPLAAFADLMVLGEAEAVLDELVEILLDCTGKARSRLVRTCGVLPGCYAPGLYRFRYDTNGAVLAVEPEAGLPPRVRRVHVADMARASHSTLFSPEAELGMYMVELGRGCSRGCRFCAAGFIYRPPRLWSTEGVLAGLAKRPDQCDRVGLLGMEMAHEETTSRIAAALAAADCSLSFSSLRADRISQQILDLLAASHLKSVAIAADGCSERLRVLINKGLDESDLLDAAERLTAAGLFHLKVYVMIGLPTETRDDLDELIGLVRRLRERILPLGRRRGRVVELTLSINCFVPKPWTPFQYCAFGGLSADEAEREHSVRPALERLKTTITYLRRRLGEIANVQCKFDSPEQALQQAILARADRRIAPALLDIGCGRHSFKQALRRHRIDPWQFAIRPRGRTERMCWEVVDHGIRPAYLWAEYERALAGRATPACEPAVCRNCGVCHEPS
jgi:radical SAM superfamily enzyme YgiQ (UPF0313 family)